MQKHYKLIMGLLECFLGINSLKGAFSEEFPVPKEPIKSTKTAIVELAESVQGFSIGPECFLLELLELKALRSPVRQIGNAQKRIVWRAVEKMYAIQSDVINFNPENLFDGTVVAYQAAQSLETGSIDCVELKRGMSILQDLIQLGKKFYISISLAEFLEKIRPMEYELVNYLFAHIDANHAYYGFDSEAPIYYCSRKYYDSHVKPRYLKYNIKISVYELLNGSVKIVSGVQRISERLYRCDVNFKLDSGMPIRFSYKCIILNEAQLENDLSEVKAFLENTANKRHLKDPLKNSYSLRFSILNIDTGLYDIYACAYYEGLVKIPGLTMGPQVPGDEGIYDIVPV